MFGSGNLGGNTFFNLRSKVSSEERFPPSPSPKKKSSILKLQTNNLDENSHLHM